MPVELNPIKPAIVKDVLGEKVIECVLGFLAEGLPERYVLVGIKKQADERWTLTFNRVVERNAPRT